ncbi:hypothetical protein [Actinoplanes couchii]|uniref:DUF305 domain-containing protein n=1 Tax=Actinoplanes couchii TaxID=403638 RepID=A0ABQ3XEY9_9ACTN|nr:hypothetical protein [Actinoplanes couchii]MDR6319915.1 hypothetical protein [Actinoplanes couchii]GID57052.1 hypothetical protein Aco03nite_054560 [Actinoplanes couchii]
MTSPDQELETARVFPHQRVFLAAGLSVGLSIGLAGCAGPPSSSPPGSSASAGAPAPSGPTLPGTSSPAGASPVAFSTTDNAWIEVNIAMNEQILPLLALATEHGANTQLKALSVDLVGRFEAELADLRQLHAEAGLPAENPHLGMPMPGMVTPEQLADATTKRGVAFDSVLREGVQAHRAQGEALLVSLMKLNSPQPVIDVAIRMNANREYIRYMLADIPEK